MGFYVEAQLFHAFLNISSLKVCKNKDHQQEGLVSLLQWSRPQKQCTDKPPLDVLIHSMG